jgi:hypothetical protein
MNVNEVMDFMILDMKILSRKILKYFGMSDEDIDNEEARLEILRNEEQTFQDYIDAYYIACENITK